MSILLSDRIQAIQPSATMAISAKAAELKAQGIDIISLSAGEPDFNTPKPISDKAIQAIEEGFTHYTAVDGTASLKAAVIQKLALENQLNYQANQVLVSCGVKHSLFNLIAALINPGDEVIIPAPYWVSYADMVQLCGGIPVILETTADKRFKLQPRQLEAAITGKTKLFLINSPSNPTGCAYSKDELSALGQTLLNHPQVVVATDDIYEHIRWADTPFVNILNATPELYDRTLVLNGVSKAYAMTGWRIGYAAGPQTLIAAMKKLQSQSTSNPTSVAQKAAEAALLSGTTYITEMVTAFKARHDYLTKALNELPGVNCMPVDGTFYAFPDVRKAIEAKGLDNDLALAEDLISKARVAGVPGTAFGAPGFIRFSYATSMDNLEKAVGRLSEYLRK